MGTGLTTHTPPAVKTNWPKHAACTLIVGLILIFWIAPLLRATVGNAGEQNGLPVDSTQDAEPVLDGGLSSRMPAPAIDDSSAAIVSRPRTEAIVLSATIIGKTRRAAVLNGRLNREGDQILIDGELFRLTNVAADRVELLRDARNSASGRHVIIRVAAEHDGKK